MSQDKELEIQLQFLDEASDYLETLENTLMGLAHQGVEIDAINAALRAAHSIKGGAAMMGFQILSELAHRLEDSFKVLKIERQTLQIDPTLEQLLLTGVDCLRQVIRAQQQQGGVSPQWLEAHAQPIFDQLYDRLGEPAAEDAQSILSPEEGQDIVPLLFQTEVEGCLQRLEEVLVTQDPRLREELEVLTQELGGLGEMLQLAPFAALCASIAQAMAAHPHHTPLIAERALQIWRQSQALILTGQRAALPDALLLPDLPEQVPADVAVPAEEIPWVAAPQAPDLHAEFVIGPTEVEILPGVGLDEIGPDRAEPAVPDLPSATPEPQPAGSVPVADLPDNTVRVGVKQLDLLNDLFSELIIERNGLDLHLKRLRNLVVGLSQRVKILEESNTQLRDAYDRVETQSVNSGSISPGMRSTEPLVSSAPSLTGLPALGSALQFAGAESDFDVLEMDRYGHLHLLSQEVMETIVQVQELTSDLELGLDDADQTTRELNKTSRQLQNRLTQLRMRPLSDITQRFPRALRDLSRQYDKSVQLKIQGEHLLIDRNILEALNEPLMHLLRNAFDHGIEAPNLRQQQGKPTQGTIWIEAVHHQNRTVITIRDDGAGIPIAKIRARAQQMGLDETLLAAASDDEILSLIFEPGFSTSERVTALSGRGVGMDVVRERLKQIQGEITVATEAGRGTMFTLSVPFTVSVARVLIAESRGMLLAFPTDAIAEILVVQPEQILTTAGNQAFAWNGKMVQLVGLSRWLHFQRPLQPESLETPAAISVPTVLLIHQAGQWIGLQVDRCWGEQEVAIRQVEGGLPLPTGFSNCTILGDGRVVPLVSLPDLLRWIASYERTSQLPDRLSYHLPAPFVPAALPAGTEQQATVLIVDDSINVRRFLALTLEKAGYQVAQAKDGQDAIDKLAAGLMVQAVICDIEMPRLDGYEFLARVKSTPTLKEIPVAMLTSRSGEKHRRLAMSLGATAYFSKPYNEQNLLQTLERMVELTPAL
jgi:two-component system, chemotaxis family, sensor histidine kinase and response regulator PixL